MKKYIATIVKNEKIAENIHAVTFSVDEEADDGSGIMLVSMYSSSPDRTISRVTVDGTALSTEEVRTDRIGDDLPAELAYHEIEWHDITEFGAPASAPLPTDGDRTVFAGTVRYYTVDELLEIEGVTDPNAINAYRLQYGDELIGVVVLDEPMEITGHRADVTTTATADMIGITQYSWGTYEVDMSQLDGEHHIFSIPAIIGWPSDVRLPHGPYTGDFRVLR